MMSAVGVPFLFLGVIATVYGLLQRSKAPPAVARTAIFVGVASLGLGAGMSVAGAIFYDARATDDAREPQIVVTTTTKLASHR
jgi:hypothetical protein